MTTLLYNKEDLIPRIDKGFKLEEVTVHSLRDNLEVVQRAHIVIVCGQNRFKVLKSRYPQLKSNIIYPIQFLSYLMFRFQAFDNMTDTTEEDWIIELTRYMPSDRIQKLSILLEGEALRRA